jgi:hypothetical protein
MPLNSAQSISNGAQYMPSTPPLKMLDEMPQSYLVDPFEDSYDPRKRYTSFKAYSNEWSQIMLIDCSLFVIG